MKIAYFNATMRKEHDGVTRVLYRLIDEINKTKDIESLFFAAIVPPSHESPVEMFQVPSFAFPFYKDYRVAYPSTLFFEEKLSQFRPDLIHINSPCTLGFEAVKYARRNNIPAVATYHTHFPSYAKYYKVKALEYYGWNYLRNLYNKCQIVYVPSFPILDELRNHGFETVELLPHGVDTSVFTPSVKSNQWKNLLGIDNKFALLFAGRLVWEKDLASLAETYKIITSQRQDVKFVLAGEGPAHEDLKNLMPCALFLGQQSTYDLSVSFASADVLVFPSTTETFGNVTIEAMASGLPPICVREGGAYGIINDMETGLIAEPHNSLDIANKINLLLNNPDLRNKISFNAWHFAQSQSWEKIFKFLFQSYNRIIHNYNLNKAA